MYLIKNNLANVLTLGNLFSGCIGAIHLIRDDYQTTAICMIISLILDFFDGFVARALQANSSLGIQLDSLADMVSFGLIPGLAMFKLLEPFGNEIMDVYLPFDIAYLGLLISLGSCLRLAIFNIDDDQKFYFKGLNTPSNTIMIFGIYYAYKIDGAYTFIAEHIGILLFLTLVSSWLLISPIKMMAMKFKSKRLNDNYPKLILLIGSIILVFVLKIMAIPLVIIYYIFVSILTLYKS